MRWTKYSGTAAKAGGNGENKPRPNAMGVSCLLEKKGRLTEEYREKHKDGKTVRLGPYYKHQQWKDGCNVSRRISVDEAEELREQINGYHQFQELAEEFVDVTIEMSQTNAGEIKKKPR